MPMDDLHTFPCFGDISHNVAGGVHIESVYCSSENVV